MKISEAIKARLKVDENKVLPNRTPEDTAKICDTESLLDKQFNGLEKAADYTSVQLTQLAGEGERSDKEEEEDLDPGLIGHTDAIRIKDKVYSVVVCKTSTEILNCLKEGTYMAVSFEINVSKLEGTSLELGTRGFRPKAIELPRARRSTRLEDNLVVIEPSLNGFKISVFIEELDDENFKSLGDLNTWIEDYQGALLERVIVELDKMGVPREALVKSQSAIGVIPRARRIYEQEVARSEAKDGETPVITQEIRTQSATFAIHLNDALNLSPLTKTTLEIGLQVYTVQVTEKAGVIAEWKSSRSNLSYFKKGQVSGRICRVTGSKRKIPVTQDSLPSVMKVLEELVPTVLTTFENIARSQLGLPLTNRVPLPKPIKCSKGNINELFNIPTAETYGYQQEYLAQAREELRKQEKISKDKKIISLMEAFVGKPKDEE